MSGRLLVALLLLCAIGWWYSPVSPRVPAIAAPAQGYVVDCPPPPAVRPGEAPRQSPVPAGMQPVRLQPARLVPLAGFSLEARVLGREDYHADRGAALSPTDLALGWGRMREDAVLARLDIGQGARFYHYRWQDEPPLPPAEIVRSSANMHMIPATAEVAAELRRVRRDDSVRIDGWLVEAEGADGSRWRSSLTREDQGNGACELVYVCAIRRL
ncbi:MAG TPA: hypothetical protein VFG18_05005 [Xanthomonadaceae bacterium]|nr:hypothetical protein [Xanthomonadaceae bacterium]